MPLVCETHTPPLWVEMSAQLEVRVAPHKHSSGYNLPNMIAL
jgi:hypothetical protein